MKLELNEGDSLEFSDDAPMYNPHIIPLSIVYKKISSGYFNLSSAKLHLFAGNQNEKLENRISYFLRVSLEITIDLRNL